MIQFLALRIKNKKTDYLQTSRSCYSTYDSLIHQPHWLNWSLMFIPLISAMIPALYAKGSQASSPGTPNKLTCVRADGMGCRIKRNPDVGHDRKIA